MKVIMFGCVAQSNVISSASRSILHALQIFVTTTSNSGACFFFECFVVAFALYAFYEYMFLRRVM